METRYKRHFKEDVIKEFNQNEISSGDFTIWCKEHKLFTKYCLLSYYDVNKDGISIYHDGDFSILRGSLFLRSKIDKFFIAFDGKKIKKIKVITESHSYGYVIEAFLGNGLTAVFDFQV